VTGRLERKLLRAILAVFVVPTVLAEAALVLLYRRGAFADVSDLLGPVLVGLPVLMLGVGWVIHSLGAALARELQAVQHGAELMATVNPDHRLDVRTGDELEALAADLNRLGDDLREARLGLRTRVEEATEALRAEREKLSAIVGELVAGVVVTSREGRITLANRAAQQFLNRGGPVLGRSVFDFVARERVGPVLERLLPGETERFAVPGEGVALHAAVTRLPESEGVLTGFVLLLRDPRQRVAGADEPLPEGSAEAPRLVGVGLRSGSGDHVPGPERLELYDFSLLAEIDSRIGAEARARRLAELTFVVLDTETTGLHPESGDRIVSLAGVRVRDGAVKRSESFDALVCPGRPIPAASTRFHGITDEMVASAPPLAAVLPEFLRFASGAVLSGHEVSFDLGFLDRELEQLGRTALRRGHTVLDIRLLSRLVHGNHPDHALEAIAGRLGVQVVGRHSALGDALTAAEVLVRQLALLERRGVVTLGQTLDALKRSRVRP
jgi:DNA polymerase-3 subunit epsilon